MNDAVKGIQDRKCWTLSNLVTLSSVSRKEDEDYKLI